MRSLPLMFANLALSVALVGCGAVDPAMDASGDDGDGKFDRAGKSNPLAMPASIVTWERQQGWGSHHVQWHTERRWDLMSAQDQSWAKGQGWQRAAIQEGSAGNGLEFLAMHRAMMQMLREKFPANTALFDGWDTPPTDPRDKANPLPHSETTPFDDNMLMSIGRLETELASFRSDDDFGLFLETALRPLAGKPGNHSADASAGIHNFLHNRFVDSQSSIDIGDPRVNLENKMFWRLHGWIDARWTSFRKAKGLSDKDPAYVKAIADARMHMSMHMKGVGVGDGDCCCCPNDPIPASIVAVLRRE